MLVRVGGLFVKAAVFFEGSGLTPSSRWNAPWLKTCCVKSRLRFKKCGRLKIHSSSKALGEIPFFRSKSTLSWAFLNPPKNSWGVNSSTVRSSESWILRVFFSPNLCLLRFCTKAMAASFPTSQAIVVGGGLGGMSEKLSADIPHQFCQKESRGSKTIAVFSGMSAANTVVENGGRVVLLVFRLRLVIHRWLFCDSACWSWSRWTKDKSSFCGGNSTKATSGINGAGATSKHPTNWFSLQIAERLGFQEPRLKRRRAFRTTRTSSLRTPWKVVLKSPNWPSPLAQKHTNSTQVNPKLV